MVRGAVGDKLVVKDYEDVEEAKKIIKGFLVTNNLINN